MSWSIPPLPLEAADHTLINSLTPLIAQGRILVVDDEPGVLTTIQAILEMEGYEVQGVASGRTPSPWCERKGSTSS